MDFGDDLRRVIRTGGEGKRECMHLCVNHKKKTAEAIGAHRMMCVCVHMYVCVCRGALW